MKASICLVASGAVLAMAAGPLDKRVVHTEVVTDVVYVTVTADPTPKSMFRNSKAVTTSTTSAETTSTTPPPAPVVVVEPTVAKQPDPVTTTSVVIVDEQAATIQAVTEQKTTAQAAAAAPSDLASSAVYHHNIHRENNSAPAVQWSETHAGYAATVAKSCKFEHNLEPGGGGYGQNIAMWGTSGDAAALGASKAIAQAITNMWYNGELPLYPSSGYGADNPDMSNFEGWGHYSQVIWVGSTQIGCAAQYCEKDTMVKGMGSWFSVCNYYPAGNMGGGYGANVLPPLGKPFIQA